MAADCWCGVEARYRCSVCGRAYCASHAGKRGGVSVDECIECQQPMPTCDAEACGGYPAFTCKCCGGQFCRQHLAVEETYLSSISGSFKTVYVSDVCRACYERLKANADADREERRRLMARWIDSEGDPVARAIKATAAYGGTTRWISGQNLMKAEFEELRRPYLSAVPIWSFKLLKPWLATRAAAKGITPPDTVQVAVTRPPRHRLAKSRIEYVQKRGWLFKGLLVGEVFFPLELSEECSGGPLSDLGAVQMGRVPIRA